MFNFFYLQYKLNRIPEGLLSGDGDGLVDWEGADKRVERGQELADEGQWQEAIAEFDSALGLDPENARAYAERGFAQAELGDFGRAISDYDQAIARTPRDDEFDFRVYNERGLAHAAMGHRDAAVKDLEQAIVLSGYRDTEAELEVTIKELRSRRGTRPAASHPSDYW